MITAIDREVIVRAMEAADIWEDDDALYEGYSGRGMFGNECFGLVCSTQEFACFLVALGVQADESIDETTVYDLARSVRTDSMGMSMIYYFPGFTVADTAEVQ